MNKKYHVYGLGNALVDIIFEVSHDTIHRLNIDKGLMTLIDAERELKLLEELDGVKHHKACGGSAANTLITLAQLGGRGFYSCKVANDDAGDFYHQDLKSAGLDSNLHYQDKHTGRTGKCIVMVTPDADRTMNSYLGITQHFSKTELIESAIADAEYIYIEGYLVASPTAYEAMHAAKQMAQRYGTKLSLTLSDLNMVNGFKHELTQVLDGGVDLLFCNQEEALHFCQTNNIDDAVKQLKSFAKQFTITLGGDGVLLHDGETTTHIKGHKVNVLDTVGAGDTFAGTFLYGITHQHDFITAGTLANRAASHVVAKYGPRLEPHHYQQLHAELANLKGSLITS